MHPSEGGELTRWCLIAAAEHASAQVFLRVLRDALVVMNANIFRAALNSTAFEGMATTVVVAWLLDDTLWVAHTGDSRLYRMRGDTFEQVTLVGVP